MVEEVYVRLILATHSMLLMMLLSFPLARGLIPRNGFYGFRTCKTLQSDDFWYAANRYAGRAMLMAGTVSLVGLLTLWLVAKRLAEVTLGRMVLAVVLVPLLAALAASLRYVRRL